MRRTKRQGARLGHAAVLTVAGALTIGLLAADAAGATSFSIDNAQRIEGDGSPPKKMRFQVTKAGAPREGTVRYRTLDGTAVASDDYTATNGKLTFSRDRRSRRVKVPLVGDTNYEDDETFVIELFRARNARLGDRRGEGTILNDDGCFAAAAMAAEADNAGDLTDYACPPGAGGDAQPTCASQGDHQWWSFTVPAGETATFTVPATGVRDLGLALFTANSSAGELVCRDSSGPAGAETATTTNSGVASLTVYVQVFALPGHEGPYTLRVESTDGCFDDAGTAVEGDNAGDLGVDSCVPSAGGDAVPSCQIGTGRHQWWSFTVPAAVTATFTVPATGVRDLGLALFTANSSAGELVCRDSSGPAGAETAMAANPGDSPVTVFVQVFAAIAGHEGAYTLNVSSTAPP